MIHNTKQVATLICCTIFLFSSHALAQFTVTASTGTINTANATFAGTSGTTSIYDIDIVYTGSSTTASATITLRSTGTYAIGDLTIETRTDPGYAPGTTIATLLIDGDDSGGIITGLNSLDWIAPTGGNLPTRFQANIQLLDDASPFGRIGFGMPKDETIEGHAFTRILARDCYANVTVIQDSLTTDGMADLELDGDMQGDVSCTYLRKMWLADGDVGMADLGSGGNTVEIEVLDRMENFYAQNAYANFDIGGELNLFQIYGSTGPGGSTSDGVFKGTLECDVAVGLVPANEDVIRLWGDLDATSAITINDELDADHAIRIGGSLDGDVVFTQSDGLKGRVTIDWLNISGDWTGDVTINGTALSPRGAYTQVPAGSGAVGLAPYGLHREACDPAYRPGYPIESPSASQRIELVHYGAIQLAPSSGIPYTVYEASGPHCDGTCIHGLLTDVTNGDPGPPVRDPWTLVGSVSGRKATIEGPTFAGKHYHIVLNVGSGSVQHLETADLKDTQVDIPSYVYIIGTQ